MIYNLNGYYDSLKALMENMVEEGFLPRETMDRVIFAESIDDINVGLCK